MLALTTGVAAQEPVADVPADAYAVVDGQPIARARVEALAKDYGFPPAAVLEDLVLQAAIARGLREAGRDPAAVTADTLEATRARLRELMSDEDLAQIDEADLRLQIALEEHVESLIDEERLRTFYEERKLLLAGEVRARHVQFPATAQGLLDAQAALAQLGAEADDAAVDRMARERSSDPFGPVNGGDLDWFGRDGQTPLGLVVPRPLTRACFERGEPGLVPYPVASRVGYHVLYVIAVRTREDAGFEAEAPRLRQALKRQLAREAQTRWREAVDVAYASDAPRLRRR
jgi:parvulin-like peptidyl-prolyl isomerase